MCRAVPVRFLSAERFSALTSQGISINTINHYKYWGIQIDQPGSVVEFEAKKTCQVAVQRRNIAFRALTCGLPDVDLADGTASPVTTACQEPVIRAVCCCGRLVVMAKA